MRLKAAISPGIRSSGSPNFCARACRRIVPPRSSSARGQRSAQRQCRAAGARGRTRGSHEVNPCSRTGGTAEWQFSLPSAEYWASRLGGNLERRHRNQLSSADEPQSVRMREGFVTFWHGAGPTGRQPELHTPGNAPVIAVRLPYGPFPTRGVVCLGRTTLDPAIPDLIRKLFPS
jgi:hypothetical protein